MKTYIITRFSILDAKSDSWVISRENKDLEKLKKNLFSEERLSEKMWTFRNLTYDSVISQKNENYFWMIYTSTQLPENYKNELYSLETDKIKIYEVDDQNEFFRKIKQYNYENEYSTVRLDDDDALHISFIDKINNLYEKRNDIKIVSFPNGLKICRKNGNLYVEKDIFRYKKIALGLTMFNDIIYLAGNHVKIDEKFKILYDQTPNMYLIYSSDNCDTKRKFNFNNCTLFKLDEFKNMN